MTPPAALDQPLYGASFGAAVSRFWRKYAQFSGRASRTEYWWMQLFWALTVVPLLIALVLDVVIFVANSEGPGPVFGIAAVLYLLLLFAAIVPTIALFVRRMHDADLSGWLALIHLVPYLGALVGIVLAILPSNPRGARFDRGPSVPWTDPYRAAPPGTVPPPYSAGPPPPTGDPVSRD